MGVYDQAARFAARADPDAVLRRVLTPLGLSLPFRECLESRPGGYGDDRVAGSQRVDQPG